MLGPISCLASALLWSLALTILRPVLRVLGADSVNLFKCLFALALFVPALTVTGLGQGILPGLSAMGGVEWSALAVSGLVGMSVGDSFIFLAAARIGAQQTLLLQCLGPVLASALGWLFFDEEPSLAQAAGILATMGGVALVVLASSTGSPPGARRGGVAFALLAMLAQALGLVLLKPALAVPGMDPAGVATIRIAIAIPGILALAIFMRRGRATLASLGARAQRTRLCAGAFLGTFLGVFLYVQGTKHSPAGVASALTSTTPIFAIPWAWWLDGVRPEARTWLGTAVAVGGVALVTL